MEEGGACRYAAVFRWASPAVVANAGDKSGRSSVRQIMRFLSEDPYTAKIIPWSVIDNLEFIFSIPYEVLN